MNVSTRLVELDIVECPHTVFVGTHCVHSRNVGATCERKYQIGGTSILWISCTELGLQVGRGNPEVLLFTYIGV